MSSFSERMGFVKPPEFIQLDGMSVELDNLLCTFCGRVLQKVFPDSFEIEFGELSQLQIMQGEVNDMLKKQNGQFCIVLIPLNS